MAGFNIDSFKANFQNAARQNLFYIYLDIPDSVLGTDKTVYLVRASGLPESTIDQIEIPWQGQSFKFGSSHTYSDWNVTFAVDIDAQIRKDFITWQELVHNPTSNEHGTPSDYMRTQRAVLLDGSGSPIMEYKLFNAWPSTVSEITLDYSAKEYAQFDVTFTYTYHTADN